MSSHVSSVEITWAELIIQKRDIQNDIDSLEKDVSKFIGSENTTELADSQRKLNDARNSLADIETKIEANRPKSIESTANSYPGSSNTNSLPCTIKDENRNQVQITEELFENEAVTLESKRDVFNNCTVPPMPISRLARLPKPPYFEKGDNFIRWTKRFKEYVSLSNHPHGTDLSTYMLSHIRCESTWDRLQRLNVNPLERCDIDLLVKRFTEEMFPPTQSWTIRTQLMAQKQSSTETVQEFCSRIEELASKAGYATELEKDQCCLQVLVIGARDTTVKTKLYESQLTSYNDAVKLAVNTERIAQVAGINSETSMFPPSHDQVFYVNQDRNFDGHQNNQFHMRQNARQAWDNSRNLVTARTPWSPNVVSNRFRGGMSNNYAPRAERPRFNPYNHGQAYRSLNCWHCGKIGHFQRDCYLKNRNTYQSDNRRSNQARNQYNHVLSDNTAPLNGQGVAQM